MDSSDVLTNKRSRSSRNSVSVDDEVQKLLRKTPDNSGDLINKLRLNLCHYHIAYPIVSPRN